MSGRAVERSITLYVSRYIKRLSTRTGSEAVSLPVAISASRDVILVILLFLTTLVLPFGRRRPWSLNTIARTRSMTLRRTVSRG